MKNTSNSKIFESLLEEIKSIDGIFDAEIIMKFMHVTCEKPDYCVFIKKENYSMVKTFVVTKVDELIAKYQSKYNLIDHGIYLFSYIE